MINLYPLQNNFAAGEISPRFLARTDLPGYTAGARELSGFIGLSHGPAVTRGGSKHIISIPGTNGRLLPFHKDESTSAIIVVSNDANLYCIDPDAPVLTDVFSSPYANSELQHIQVAMTPGGNWMYFVHTNRSPRKLVWNPTTSTWDSFAAVTWTSKPSEWVTNNYPGCITFFQGRMWLAGTPAEPNQFWGSKSGLYEDMTTGSTADAAISFFNAQHGEIRWMAGIKNLLLGTSRGEFIVTSESGLVTYSDVFIEQQSAFGSKRAAPLVIGNSVLYISPDGRKVRETSYKWTEESWVSRDLTYSSEHITKDRVLKELTFAQNPENLIWGTCEEDTSVIIGSTYEKANNIIGWHKHPSNGIIRSVATIEESGVSRTFALVDRGVTDQLELELWNEENANLDSYIEIDSTGSPTDQITGGDHLANQTVKVIVDGALHSDVTLDASGEATLDYPGEIIQFGLAYTPYFRSLPFESQIQGDNIAGSAMGMQKRWSNIALRLIDSCLPLVNGKRTKDRYPSTPMDTPEELRTGDIKLTNLGWDRYAEVEVEVDLPFKCMIGGIFGKVTLNE